jgi:hypothetical protein
MSFAEIEKNHRCVAAESLGESQWRPRHPQGGLVRLEDSSSDRGFLSCGSKQGRRYTAIPKVILAHPDAVPMMGDEMPRLQTRSPWGRG